MIKIVKKRYYILKLTAVAIACATNSAIATKTKPPLIPKDSSIPQLLQPITQPYFLNIAARFAVTANDSNGANITSVIVNAGTALNNNGLCNNSLASGLIWTQGQQPYISGAHISLTGEAVYNKLPPAIRDDVGCISYQLGNDTYSASINAGVSNLCQQTLDCTSTPNACVYTSTLQTCNVAFNIPFAYVADYFENQVLRCALDVTGTISDCAATTDYNFTTPIAYNQGASLRPPSSATW